MKLGADYAFDPFEPDFVDKVKAVTGGNGVRATVEVTGVSAAMRQALECASWMGRISRVVSPTDAPEIYNQLCDDPNFPIGTVFDWREID